MASPLFHTFREDSESGFSTNVSRDGRSLTGPKAINMTEPGQRLLIDIRELSDLTGIAVGSLYHMVSQHRIPCVKLSQRCLRFSLPAIREWLDDLSEPAVAEESRRRFGKMP
jgi:predicted DNA-binding transcriptional regulator AlpA